MPLLATPGAAEEQHHPSDESLKQPALLSLLLTVSLPVAGTRLELWLFQAAPGAFSHNETGR